MECVKCERRVNNLIEVRTTDNVTLCNICYNKVASILTKGVFDYEEVKIAITKEEEMLKDRNDKFMIMLQATLLNGNTAYKMIEVLKEEIFNRCKKYYNHKPKLLSVKEKNFLVQDIFNDYKELFGDFSTEECSTKVIRDEKDNYYEYLTRFNSDLIY